VEEAVQIPVGRPTVVFSGEDPASRHQFQLAVTAVPRNSLPGVLELALTPGN
jgi:hypothetical protein